MTVVQSSVVASITIQRRGARYQQQLAQRLVTQNYCQHQNAGARDQTYRTDLSRGRHGGVLVLHA